MKLNKILLIHGPNLNLLGMRETDIYGQDSQQELFQFIDSSFPEIEFIFFQSNHEGVIIDTLHNHKDLVEAIIRTLKKKETSGEIINLGHGKPNQIKNVILHISKIIKLGKPTFGKIGLRKDEIIKLYPNINKAKKLLKWKPKINLHQGLIRTINFYKKNKYFFK